jgi:hypothetical protein
LKEHVKLEVERLEFIAKSQVIIKKKFKYKGNTDLMHLSHNDRMMGAWMIFTRKLVAILLLTIQVVFLLLLWQDQLALMPKVLA